MAYPCEDPPMDQPLGGFEMYESAGAYAEIRNQK